MASPMTAPVPSLIVGNWLGTLTIRFSCGFTSGRIVKQPDKLRLKAHALINRLLDLTDNSPVDDALIGSEFAQALLNLF
jgi:hypothetical protein